jgi:hypothetical protein
MYECARKREISKKNRNGGEKGILWAGENKVHIVRKFPDPKFWQE